MPSREELIAEWDAVAASAPSFNSATGLASMEEMKSLRGLDFLQRIVDGKVPAAHISRLLGFFLLEVAEGHAVFQGRPAREHYNPLGSVHGGFFCTLLDSALGCAVQTTLPAGMGYTTLELKVNLIRPLTDKTGPVRAVGKIINGGRQVGIAEANIVDVEGKVYAHATTTCLVFPLP